MHKRKLLAIDYLSVYHGSEIKMEKSTGSYSAEKTTFVFGEEVATVCVATESWSFWCILVKHLLFVCFGQDA